MKRVRSSQARDQRFYSSKQTLTIRWRDAIRKHVPLHVTYTAIHEWIASLDVTIEQRRSLQAGHWALRDFAVSSCARWQLYLDGVPRTFDEIADFAKAAERDALFAGQGPGPAHDAYLAVMNRIHGRHEWEASHDPFYEADPPELLRSDCGTTSTLEPITSVYTSE